MRINQLYSMQVIHPRCAGLDVHKSSVAACVWLTAPDGSSRCHHQSFGATTPDLLRLSDWLQAHQVTHVAMESTGVYWRPVYEVLEEQLTLLVANAEHVKKVPGRKTDVGDAQWLGDLLRHGLIRPSYVPPRPQRQLRELLRHRRSLVQRRAQVVNELQKTLELANIKLAGVATDITGVSATEMLQGLLAGQSDPALLAELARGKLRQKKEQLTKALTGRLREHHRLMLTQQLGEIHALEEDIELISAEIARRLAQQQEIIDRLDDIPGVNRRVAETIIVEMGTDPKVFGGDVKRAMAWSGVCPGNYESAGKRKRGSVRRGNRVLTTVAVEAALAAARTKKSYFGVLYKRMARRRGHKSAIMAVAHAILKTAFVLIQRGTRYQDLGADYFDRRRPEQVLAHLRPRLAAIGYQIIPQAVST